MKEVRNLKRIKQRNTGENRCEYIVEYLLYELSEDPPIPAVYLALEICSGNLEDFVNSRRRSSPESANFDCGGLTPKTILHQLIQAVGFLHSQDILHRDIKPRNCLISRGDTGGRKVMKLSDFGLSQCRESSSTRSLAVGSYGWMAPEVMLDAENRDPAIDIFSLGCVFFYVVSDGGHIFADADTRVEVDFHLIQKSINQKKYRLQSIKQLMVSDFEEFEKTLLQVLLQKMVSFKPKDRPSALDIMDFPTFFSKDQLRKFFHDIGNAVDVPKCNKKCKSKKAAETCEHEKKVTPQTKQLLHKLNTIDASVIKGNWYKQLDEVVQNYCLTNFSKKDGNNITALCRAIRNNIEHFAKYQNAEVRRLFGEGDLGVIDYYIGRFPDLLYSLYVCYHETMTQDTNPEIWRLGTPFFSSPTYTYEGVGNLGLLESSFWRSPYQAEKPWMMDPLGLKVSVANLPQDSWPLRGHFILNQPPRWSNPI